MLIAENRQQKFMQETTKDMVATLDGILPEEREAVEEIVIAGFNLMAKLGQKKGLKVLASVVETSVTLGPLFKLLHD